MSRFALRVIALIAIGAALGGCASTSSVIPDDYTGPTATLHDSVYQESWTKGRVFAAVAIDGQRIRSAFTATREATAGRGFNLVTSPASRGVPAKPMKVVLKASHVTGAPIQEIALRLAGEIQDVEGEVDWVPKPDTIYVVRGELQPGASSVWIEERETKQRVTAIVGPR